MNLTRRRFIWQATVLGSLSYSMAADAAPDLLHCTPAPRFPIPLTEGIWRSPEFPVGKHNYHLWLNVDRSLPLVQLDCDLGPPRPGNRCDTTPLLNIDWKLFDGTAPVKSWTAKPIKAAGWGEDETSCFLGDFNGKRNVILRLNSRSRRTPDG